MQHVIERGLYCKSSMTIIPLVSTYSCPWWRVLIVGAVEINFRIQDHRESVGDSKLFHM